jgi:hypothetical protein
MVTAASGVDKIFRKQLNRSQLFLPNKASFRLIPETLRGLGSIKKIRIAIHKSLTGKQ